MLLYSTNDGLVLERGGHAELLEGLAWDDVFRAEDPAGLVLAVPGRPVSVPDPREELRPPVASQEIWAAGVTYFRSRSARMDESKEAGASVFYDRVYEAARPELFFKGSGWRARGHRAGVRVRGDSGWSVPEPELVLAVNAAGRIFGFTVGNDMSARDIEGDNPLYLPQAKVYRGSCALGPAVLLAPELPPDTAIAMQILRGGQEVFAGETSLAQLKRTPGELVQWLFAENEFPDGVLLFTGTGLVPPGKFTLVAGDEISIRIDGVGTLVNVVEP